MEPALATPPASTTEAEPRAHSYWRETRFPVYSAALVLPFIIVYEAGLLLTRSNVINGGDAILLTLGGRLFQLAGVHASFVSAAALLAYFLIWQIRRHGPWRVQFDRLVWMFLESLLYAVILFQLLGYFVQFLPRDRRAASGATDLQSRCIGTDPCPSDHAGTGARHGSADGRGPVAPTYPLPADARAPKPAAKAASIPAQPTAPPARATAIPKPGLLDFVLYCGAGVYEELVFRALLLGLLMLVCTKLFHMEHAYAAVWAVLAGAVIFAAFHHIGGEQFTWGAFLQRGFAGLYFSAIYFNRCFGVAAASHALYDILVGLHLWRM